MKKPYLAPYGILALLLLGVFSLALGGCEDKAPENTRIKRTQPVIGVLLYRSDDIYISLVYSAMQKALEGKAELVMLAASEDQLTQNEQFDKLLSDKVDAIAVNLVDTQAAASVVDIAKKNDLPVVFFNRQPDMNVIKLYDKACFVGTSTHEAGVLQGRIIANLWHKQPHFDRNGDGSFQYIMFQGNADNPEAIARTEYSVREARSLGVDMRQLGQTYVCNWDGKLAREAMRVAMIMHGKDLELIISNNDAMALGAIEVLAEFGFNLPGSDKSRFIPVVGVDAVPQAIEAIEQGIMSATVRQDGEGMGKAIASLIMNIVQGRGFLDDLPYKWDESGVAIRLPYSMLTGK